MFWTASAFYQQLQVSYVGLCFIIIYFFKSTVGKFFESEMVLKLLSVFRTLL